MTKNYFFLKATHTLPGAMRRGYLALGVFLAAFGASHAQATYTFLPAGATGSTGPTSAMTATAYASTNLNGSVTVTGGIQSFTIPSTGPYQLDLLAASGGTPTNYPTKYGGLAARVVGEFNFIAGDVLKIMVGQKGENGCGASGGGGATFVTRNNVIIMTAGGGGGGTFDYLGGNAVLTTSGSNDVPGGTTPGGTNGGGGSVCSGGSSVNEGGGGGGYSGNGSTAIPGLSGFTNGGGGFSFLNGGTGGTGTTAGARGGFGGGGGATDCTCGGGGGGGYSGGGGGQQTGSCSSLLRTGGGGGGSYNTGTNQTNSIVTTAGDGRVVLKGLCDVQITASGSNSIAPAICAGTSLTLTTNAVSNYTWINNGNTSTTSIVVSPATTTTYTLIGQSALTCSNAANITVIVSPGTPTLSLAGTSQSVCLGAAATITASGALTYTWSNSVANGGTFTPASTSVYTITGGNGCGLSVAQATITVAPLPVTAAASSTLVCASTAATLNAGGATTFTWMPGANTSTNFIVSPAANTIYTVMGTSGPCTGSTTILISTKPNPTITITPGSTLVCEGLPVTLNVSGNASTYTWNPGGQTGTSISVSPTMATMYSVIGTSTNNCVATANQVVLVSPAPVITASVSDMEVCVGGLVTLSASGGNTYQWSSNAGSATGPVTTVNPNASETYTVTGTSTAGCNSTATVNISVFAPTVGVSSNTAVCQGKPAQLVASGADSYTWNSGQGFAVISVTPALNTVYTVTGTVNQNGLSCTATNTVSVTVNPNPTVTASSNHTAICIGQSAALSAAGADTYSWSSPSGPLSGSSVTVSPILDVTYTVNGTDVNGCKNSGTIFVKVATCVGIEGYSQNGANLLIYPNPSNGEFTITADQAIELQLINELGQLMKQISLDGAHSKATVNGLANGVYFITGKNANGVVKEKIIVNK